MNFSKILFTTLVSVCLLGSALAQGPGPGAGGFKMTPEMKKSIDAQQQKMIKEISAELKLTPDQEKKVFAVHKDTSAKMMKMMNSGGDMNAKQGEMMKIQKDAMGKLQKIMNPGQWKKFQEKLASMRGGPKAG